MRLWSIHPKYLDRQGLLGLWREALLAQAVLLGRTNGYRNHPQLLRFQACGYEAVPAICFYLWEVHKEGLDRSYKFNSELIHLPFSKVANVPGIEVSSGQLEYEFNWLETKLKQRNPVQVTTNQIKLLLNPLQTHQLFIRTNNPNIEYWEKPRYASPV